MEDDNYLTITDIFTTKKILGLQLLIFSLCVSLDLALFVTTHDSVTPFLLINIGVFIWGLLGIISKKLIMGNGFHWTEYSGEAAVIHGGIMSFIGLIASVFNIILSRIIV